MYQKIVANASNSAEIEYHGSFFMFRNGNLFESALCNLFAHRGCCSKLDQIEEFGSSKKLPSYDIAWCFFLAAEKKTPFWEQLKQIFCPSYFDGALGPSQVVVEAKIECSVHI